MLHIRFSVVVYIKNNTGRHGLSQVDAVTMRYLQNKTAPILYKYIQRHETHSLYYLHHITCCEASPVQSFLPKGHLVFPGIL